jgi:hypothetical protein
MKVLSSSKSSDFIADMALDLIHSLSWEGMFFILFFLFIFIYLCFYLSLNNYFHR